MIGKGKLLSDLKSYAKTGAKNICKNGEIPFYCFMIGFGALSLTYSIFNDVIKIKEGLKNGVELDKILSFKDVAVTFIAITLLCFGIGLLINNFVQRAERIHNDNLTLERDRLNFEINSSSKENQKSVLN